MASIEAAKLQVSHHRVEVNGIRLHYIAAGAGEPVVLLHGFPETSYAWRKIIPALSTQFTVIAPDLRGCGNSDRPDGSYDKRTIAEDVHQLVQHLELEPINLVGHDVGMMVAYAYAAAYPTEVRRLVLMEAALPGLGLEELYNADKYPRMYHLPLFEAPNGLAEALIVGRERLFVEHFMLQQSYDPTGLDQEALEEYARCLKAPGALRGGISYFRSHKLDAKHNRENAKTRLPMPVLTVGGAASFGAKLEGQIRPLVKQMQAVMIRDPDVDLVAACVRVPNHRELVLGAIAAGKHIYCEWPLGRNLAETEEMAAAADAASVHVAIGLQARMNPAANRARDLVTSGALGRVLSAQLYSSTGAFGQKIATADSYLENAENGATLVTIHGGHALDLVNMLLGQLTDMSALTTVQYPEIQVGDDSKQARAIPDHLLVQAHLVRGGALSIEVAGGRPPGAPFRLEVIGEEGMLALDGGALRGFSTGRLRLSLNDRPQSSDEGELAAMPDTAVNVAGVYAALRDDIAHGSTIAPDFAHAVHLARLVDEVQSAAQTGTRSQST